MRLIVHCKNCKKDIKLKEFFVTRFELSEKLNKDFELECYSCNHKSTYSADEVYARKGIIVFIASILIIPVICFMFFLLYPYAFRGIITLFLIPIGLLIPILIFASILKDENRKIQSFNSTRPNSLKSIKFARKF